MSDPLEVFLFPHTTEVLAAWLTFMCCWHFTKQPSEVWVLFPAAQAYTLNSKFLESVLITNKFGQIQNYIFPPWSNILGIHRFTYYTKFSANEYWENLANYLIYMYLLGQTLICLPELLGYDTKYRTVSSESGWHRSWEESTFFTRQLAQMRS